MFFIKINFEKSAILIVQNLIFYPLLVSQKMRIKQRYQLAPTRYSLARRDVIRQLIKVHFEGDS